MPECTAAAGTRVINYPVIFYYPTQDEQVSIKCTILFSIISNKPTTTTYKGGLHFTVICCRNKCIINERYIPEHQNKLNIYDLQNYDFLRILFNRKNS